jgi:threonine/homoserine/homoserine lactone efflux protein
MSDFIPDLPTLLTYAVAAFLLAVTPGPDMALFLSRTVTGGQKSGMAAMLGASLGMMVHATLAGLGLSALLAASATGFMIVKIVGAVYLLFLAWQAVRHGSGLTLDTTTHTTESFFKTFVTGLGINLTNPKVVMFFVTFLPQFVEPTDPHATDKILFLGLFFLVVGIPVNGFFILTAERFSNFLRSSPVLMRRFDYGFAALMSAFALKLFLTQAR